MFGRELATSWPSICHFTGGCSTISHSVKLASCHGNRSKWRGSQEMSDTVFYSPWDTPHHSPALPCPTPCQRHKHRHQIHSTMPHITTPHHATHRHHAHRHNNLNNSNSPTSISRVVGGYFCCMDRYTASSGAPVVPWYIAASTRQAAGCPAGAELLPVASRRSGGARLTS